MVRKERKEHVRCEGQLKFAVLDSHVNEIRQEFCFIFDFDKLCYFISEPNSTANNVSFTTILLARSVNANTIDFSPMDASEVVR